MSEGKQGTRKREVCWADLACAGGRETATGENMRKETTRKTCADLRQTVQPKKCMQLNASARQSNTLHSQHVHRTLKKTLRELSVKKNNHHLATIKNLPKFWFLCGELNQPNLAGFQSGVSPGPPPPALRRLPVSHTESP